MVALASAATAVTLMPPPTAVAAPAGQAPTLAPAVVPAARTARPRIVVRAGTFNVRTARARHDKRTWLKRAPDVAREIVSRQPGVVALQELGPGRADGRKAKIKGSARQTTSLVKALHRYRDGRSYRLVRSTSYVKPGTAHGTQGARILYDASRYSLRSKCRETTGKKAYNSTCSFDLPVLSGDSRKLRRSAAYAAFRERRTNRPFLVVSAHLDNRHSKSKAREARYNRLRVAQVRAIDRRMARLNTNHLPVVFGGDINSWQTDRGRYAPHRALVARDYRDAVTAPTRINYAYPTVNHWRTVLKKSKASHGGPRLDVVMVKRARGFRRYENKTARVDRARPSDHNLVLGDAVL